MVIRRNYYSLIITVACYLFMNVYFLYIDYGGVCNGGIEILAHKIFIIDIDRNRHC